MNARIALVTSLLGVLVAAPARASDPTAETLYQEGRQAAQAKDWETACKKFRQSNDREPAPGTLLNLGDCEENRGNLLLALSTFESAARLFRAGDERVGYAKQRAAAVERRIPKLTLRLDPASPAGSTVARDGVTVDAASLGTPGSVDPGEHEIVLHSPGRADVRSTVRLAEGESREIVLGAAGPTAAAPEGSRATSGSTSASDLRTVGYVGLGVGAVGVVLGTIGGVITLNAKSTTDANCPAAGCNATGYDAESRGKTWSTVSTAAFVVGGIGLAAGAGILLFGAKDGASNVSALPLPGGGGLRASATF